MSEPAAASPLATVTPLPIRWRPAGDLDAVEIVLEELGDEDDDTIMLAMRIIGALEEAGHLPAI